MKIGIVGNYGNDNNGDEAILQSIIEQVKAAFSVPSENITVFSNNTLQTAAQYGVKSYPLYYRKSNLYKTFYTTYRLNRQYVSEFDLLIIGGGGILMDFYRREAHLYGTYAMMAQSTKVPYIIYGCGAGPLDTMTGKLMIRYMCKGADSVSVRDPESKQLLEQIGVKKDIIVIGDPAFTLHKPKEQHAETPIKIGMSAVPVYNANYWPSGDMKKYEAYVEGVAKNLDTILENHNAHITFFATKYPQDVSATKDIQKVMKYAERTSIVDENLKPDALMDIASEQDVIIGTRLHSLIIATNSETPIIGISYHVKVNDFMKLIDAYDRCFSIEAIEADATVLNKAFTKMKDNWTNVVEETKQTSLRFHKAALGGKELMVKAVKGK